MEGIGLEKTEERPEDLDFLAIRNSREIPAKFHENLAKFDQNFAKFYEISVKMRRKNGKFLMKFWIRSGAKE